MFLFPDNIYVSAGISCVIGVFVPFIFTVSRDCFHKQLVLKRRRGLYRVFSRFYNLIFACASVCHWRSLWILLDYWLGFSYSSAFGCISFGLIGLTSLKCLRNSVFSPLYVARDFKEGIFVFHTMFDIHARNDLKVCFCDAIFGIVIVGYLIVFLWRGTFCLLDVALLPENLEVSARFSVVIGYSISVSAIFLQWPISSLAEISKGGRRIMVLNCLTLFAYAGSVITWRGFWNIYPSAILPDDPLKSNLVMAITGFGSLSFLDAAQSAITKGVYTDGMEPGGEPAFLAYQYLDFQEHNKKEDKSNYKPCSSIDDDEVLIERLSVV
ncbi:uncharacterized protein LOC136030411 [Artemia franciscana]|uniref:uncharacterized protein LOC136030411 n=1 Tax=Artemia franciscana TaxID=6661 RepID=UPI0032DBAA6E